MSAHALPWAGHRIPFSHQADSGRQNYCLPKARLANNAALFTDRLASNALKQRKQCRDASLPNGLALPKRAHCLVLARATDNLKDAYDVVIIGAGG